MVFSTRAGARTITNVAFGLVVLGLGGCAAHMDGDGLVERVAVDGQPRTVTLRGSLGTTLGEGEGVLRFDRKCRVRGDSGERAGATCLMRFPQIGIPKGSQVKSVRLHLEVLRGSPELVDVHAVWSSWSVSSATWQKRNGWNAWELPGGKGAADRSAPFQALILAEPGAFEATFNEGGIALVQSWIDDPSTNRGIMISSEASSPGVTFASSRHRVAERRPALTITYVAPD